MGVLNHSYKWFPPHPPPYMSYITLNTDSGIYSQLPLTQFLRTGSPGRDLLGTHKGISHTRCPHTVRSLASIDTVASGGGQTNATFELLDAPYRQ